MSNVGNGGMPPPKNNKKHAKVQTDIKNYDITTTIQNPTIKVPHYDMSGDNLWVFTNGKLEIRGIDYVEVDECTIRFQKTIHSGAQVHVRVISVV